MKCPSCSHPDNRVLESRSALDGVRRVRECLRCEHRYSTRERLEPNLLDSPRGSTVPHNPYGLTCPFCDASENKNKTISSRSTLDGKAIRRERECLHCGKQFKTLEQIQTLTENADAQSSSPEREPSSPGKGLVLSIDVSDDAPTDVIALELANLCKAINAYHIACGGAGLAIDDWEILVLARQLVGV